MVEMSAISWGDSDWLFNGFSTAAQGIRFLLASVLRWVYALVWVEFVRKSEICLTSVHPPTHPCIDLLHTWHNTTHMSHMDTWLHMRSHQHAYCNTHICANMRMDMIRHMHSTHDMLNASLCMSHPGCVPVLLLWVMYVSFVREHACQWLEEGWALEVWVDFLHVVFYSLEMSANML